MLFYAFPALPSWDLWASSPQSAVVLFDHVRVSYAPWNVRRKNMEAGAPCQLRPWCDGSLQDCGFAITMWLSLNSNYNKGFECWCRTLDKSLFSPSDTTKQYVKDGRKRFQGNKDSLKKSQVYPKLFGKKVLWLFCGAVETHIIYIYMYIYVYIYLNCVFPHQAFCAKMKYR